MQASGILTRLRPIGAVTILVLDENICIERTSGSLQAGDQLLEYSVFPHLQEPVGLTVRSPPLENGQEDRLSERPTDPKGGRVTVISAVS